MDDLLDVNVLVALFWPQHEMHSKARAWFGHRSAQARWASCSLTQTGFIRVLVNPAVNQGTLGVTDVSAVLERGIRRPDHRFWQCGPDWPEALRLAGVEVEGHRQVSDIYLIGLAVHHKGRLVTFDRALGKLSDRVVVL